MRALFLFSLFLISSTPSFTQKFDQCKFQESSMLLNDTTITNKLLNVSYQYGNQFTPIKLMEVNRILNHSHIDVVKSDSGSLVPIDYSKKTRHAIIYQMQETDFDSIAKQVHFTIAKNFIVGLNEDIHLENYLNEIRELGLYYIHMTEDKPICAYKDSYGLWWYYVKYSLKNSLDRVSYTIIKNYNNHLAMVFYFDNLETTEDIASYIERISIRNWNDDLKLKKSKNDCY